MRYPTPTTIKMTVGRYRLPVTAWNEKNRIFFSFPFNRDLMAEIKIMEGHKWHGFDETPRKLWSVADSPRNHFAIDYLAGLNPYGRYETTLDTSWVPLTRWHKGKNREVALLIKQPLMAAHMYQRKEAILAAEMGTSKTLACIIVIERAWDEYLTENGYTAVSKTGFEPFVNPAATNPAEQIWYVSPRAALDASRREFDVWGSKVLPRFMTYEAVVKEMKNWTPGRKAPFLVVFDECSKVKNFQSQRSQACYNLACGIRSDHPKTARIIEMSGSPAPKSPIDWWSLAEIACPGFLREGDVHKFKNRLAVIIQKEGPAGGSYPEVVAWKDRDGICEECGKGCNAPAHDPETAVLHDEKFHQYKPCKNEVLALYQRLSGLTLVLFKKDCIDLPDKNYRIIECKPDLRTERAAKMLMRSSSTVIEGLTRVRELSDGFQYEDEVSGEARCTACFGTGKVKEYDEDVNNPTEIKCPNCKGTGKVDTLKRVTKAVPCPKDQVITDLLEEYEDVGRVVIFAGFEGSIERVTALCCSQGWHVIQVNAGKDTVWTPEKQKLPIKLIDALGVFQDLGVTYPRVAFVAHPGSGGMGITLTASPVIIYYSNDFNAEHRIQSEDRIHRPGMDINRGATIIDIVHLHTDLKVLANLKKKRDLQALTLGQFDEVMTDDFQVETR